MKEIGAQMPSAIVDESNSGWKMINRWLTGVIGLEKHHGSSGKSILPDLYLPVDSLKDDDVDRMIVDSQEEAIADQEVNKATANKSSKINSVTDSNSTTTIDG